VNSLEKRLEAFLDSGNSQNKDKLRNSLADLLKENEKNKREIFEKAREIEKHLDTISKLTSKNSRLSKKIEQLKTKKVSKNPEQEDENHGLKDDMNKQENFDFLKSNTLPNTLEYRINNLKSDYASEKFYRNIFQNNFFFFLRSGQCSH
jgi:chromosome segregation ATPase